MKLIILGGYDAAECANLLKKYDVPVVIGAVHRVPERRSDEYDRAYTLAARLHKAGVKFCISGTERSKTWNARNLAYHAATAAAFGLPVDEAIRSITLTPAEIFGVDDRIGSLTVGKDASLIVTDGNPLEVRTNVLQAYHARPRSRSFESAVEALQKVSTAIQAVGRGEGRVISN